MNLLKKAATMLFRPSDERIAELLGSGMMSDAGESVTSRTAMQISTVNACVSRIAGTMATLPVGVVRVGVNGIPEDVPSHPLNRILRYSPNYDQTPIDFFDFMGSAIELEGDAIAAKIFGGTGQVVGLEPLVPSSVSRRRLANGKIEYRWTKDGRSFVTTEENVLHIRGPGGNPLGGRSTLSYARDTMGLARAAERTQGRIFKNGVRPTVALTFDAWLKPDQRDLAKTKLANDIAGVDNSGRPVVLEGGSKIEKLSIDPVDAEILMTRSFTVEELCRFFDMPPVMIGHTSKTTSWPAGVEAQFLIFMQLCLLKRVKRFEAAMEKQLLTPQEWARGLRIKFNLEGLLRAESLGRAQFYQIMRQIGAYTINEIRALEGKTPVQGGDEILVQMQDIPLAQAGKKLNAEQPAKTPEGGDDDVEG